MGQLKVGIVNGWSAPLDFQLLSDGAPFNLTSLTVTATARNRYAQDVTLTGNLSVIDATDGELRLIPDATDFLATDSPYELRFKVRDSSTQDAFWPNEEPVLLIVRP